MRNNNHPFLFKDTFSNQKESSLLSLPSSSSSSNLLLLVLPFALFFLLEGLVSWSLGIDFVVLLSVTLAIALLDSFFLHGALLNDLTNTFLLPQRHYRIARHEAGHFLIAYLLGCPVEGCVVSAWDALWDARFQCKHKHKTKHGVGGGVGGDGSIYAGTSFFDPNMMTMTMIHPQQTTLQPQQDECSHNSIASSSNNVNHLDNYQNMPCLEGIDRYSTILMAGMAAEALSYGDGHHADGGVQDLLSLFAFLSKMGITKEESYIRAQQGMARAIFLLKKYKLCYDALVSVLNRGGSSLGKCISEIEKAGRTMKKR